MKSAQEWLPEFQDIDGGSFMEMTRPQPCAGVFESEGQDMNSNTRDALIDFIDAVCNIVNGNQAFWVEDQRRLLADAKRLKDKLKGDETIP